MAGSYELLPWLWPDHAPPPGAKSAWPPDQEYKGKRMRRPPRRETQRWTNRAMRLQIPRLLLMKRKRHTPERQTPIKRGCDQSHPCFLGGGAQGAVQFPSLPPLPVVRRVSRMAIEVL